MKIAQLLQCRFITFESIVKTRAGLMPAAVSAVAKSARNTETV